MSAVLTASVQPQRIELITNVATNPTTGAAVITRQFGSQYAEVDTKSTNGTDSYNAFQMTLNRRFSEA
jgi:hypothetical protein